MKAEMTTFYADADACRSDACEVVFRGDELILSYEDIDCQGRAVVYSGKASSPNQWIVNCLGMKGQGTLSRSPLNEDCLEGSWTEGGYHGMWQIDLEAK